MSTLKVDTITGKTTAGTVAMPAGHVIQVVQGEVLTQVSNSSNSFSDLVTQAITPKFSSSSIYISCTGCGTPEANNAIFFRILRDSTEIGSGSGGSNNNVIGALTNPNSGGTNGFDIKGWAFQFLDAPSTTNSITYKLQSSANNGTAKIGGRQDNTDIAVPSRITLMEIKQ
tara:strand:+ start:518 stop:1030 length:513 start_codon:yes stop_codon:yes gene_type:complete